MTKKINTAELRTRAFSIKGHGPATLDKEARAVDVTAATEEPVSIYDPEYGRINEILLMTGCKLPSSRQVPLLDTHNRYSTDDIIGSVRGLKVIDTELSGQAVFSSTDKADRTITKVDEGHITDLSVGYRVLKSVFIPANTSQAIGGRSFNGPAVIRTAWQVKEISVCAIGADDRSKMRTENQGGIEMPEELRKKLEKLGLRADATEAEAWEFLNGLDIVTKSEPAREKEAQAVDTAKVRREIVEQEKQRAADIRAMVRELGLEGSVADDMIARSVTIESARNEALAKVIASLKTPPAGTGGVEIGKDERDKFREAAMDSLLVRVGNRPEKLAPGADEIVGYSLRELARLALRKAGRSDAGEPIGMVGRALTTSDLPIILADVANKQLLTGWTAAEETWQTWCSIGSLSDFREVELDQVSELDDLDLLPENAEYKYGKIAEFREKMKLSTYGKLFSISRQAIINDDLGVISTIPERHGRAAARKIGDLAYAILTANANMSDGQALFYAATHYNLHSAGAPSVSTLNIAVAAMKKQKDSNGKTLNIRPVFFIAPVDLEGTAEQLFRSTLEGTQAKPNQINPYAGTYFTRVYEARLSASSTTLWYLAAQKGMTVQVGFLNGQTEPYLEQRQGWNVDGVEFKVRIDAGAKALDWRGLSRT